MRHYLDMWICNLYASIVQHADRVACTQHQYANQTGHPEQLSDERIISYAQHQSNGTESLLIGSKNHLRLPLSIEKRFLALRPSTVYASTFLWLRVAGFKNEVIYEISRVVETLV